MLLTTARRVTRHYCFACDDARPDPFATCRTHLRRVSAVHPIFAAIDSIAAHCDSCSPSCSNTSLTARSRTSGEYLFVVFITSILSRNGVSGNPGAVHIARKLAMDRSVTCASPAYLKQHGTPKTPADLAHHTCLGYTYTGNGDEWRFKSKNDAEDEVIQIAWAIRANNGDMLRLAALNGAGLIREPLFIVGDDLQAGRLVPVLVKYPSVELGIYAVYPSRKHLSAKVRTFVDFLADRLGAMPKYRH